MKLFKSIATLVSAAGLLIAVSGCEKVEDVLSGDDAEKTPEVIKKAEKKEAARQDKTWTAENIQKEPYLYIQDQIVVCDKTKAQLEARKISISTIRNQCARRKTKAENSLKATKGFLAEAKAAYKAAAAAGTWPATLNGRRLSQAALEDVLVEAADRIKEEDAKIMAETANLTKLDKNLSLCEDGIRAAARLRRRLESEAELVQTKKAVVGIEGISTTMNAIQDTLDAISSSPNVVTLDDVMSGAPDTARKARLAEILAED